MYNFKLFRATNDFNVDKWANLPLKYSLQNKKLYNIVNAAQQTCQTEVKSFMRRKYNIQDTNENTMAKVWQKLLFTN